MNPRSRVSILLPPDTLLGGAGVEFHLTEILQPQASRLQNTVGGKDRKTYILESTGNGAAIFDYEGDSANDILIANGTTLEDPVKGAPRTVQFYQNDGGGNFTVRSREAGFTAEGWAHRLGFGDIITTLSPTYSSLTMYITIF